MFHLYYLLVLYLVFKSLLKVLEQLDYRTKQVQDFIEKNNINIEELDIIVARAGTIPPVPYTGAYEVNKLMLGPPTRR